jgi:hypothetical protein
MNSQDITAQNAKNILASGKFDKEMQPILEAAANRKVIQVRLSEGLYTPCFPLYFDSHPSDYHVTDRYA